MKYCFTGFYNFSCFLDAYTPVHAYLCKLELFKERQSEKEIPPLAFKDLETSKSYMKIYENFTRQVRYNGVECGNFGTFLK